MERMTAIRKLSRTEPDGPEVGFEEIAIDVLEVRYSQSINFDSSATIARFSEPNHPSWRSVSPRAGLLDESSAYSSVRSVRNSSTRYTASMRTAQAGIVALGTSSHVYLEFDLVDEKCRGLAAAVAGIREPRTTTGGVNFVIGFRPELWHEMVPEQTPTGIVEFNKNIEGVEGFVMPATQHDALVWMSGSAYDVVFDMASTVIRDLAGRAVLKEETSSWAYRHDRDLTGFVDGSEKIEWRSGASIVVIRIPSRLSLAPIRSVRKAMRVCGRQTEINSKQEDRAGFVLTSGLREHHPEISAKPVFWKVCVGRGRQAIGRAGRGVPRYSGFYRDSAKRAAAASGRGA